MLFITATRLGDAVLSCGLLDHLLRTWPDAQLTIACGPVAAELFARVPRLDAVIPVEKRRYDLHWLALWRRCASTRWDLAVDLRGSAVTFLLPARRRTVMRGGRRPGHRITHLAATLGLSEPPTPRAWFDDADRRRAASLLPDGAPILALGPTANWDGKIWPPDRFAALFDHLAARIPGLRAAVFAGPGATERALADALLDRLQDPIDLCGTLALPEVAACLDRCRLFVGNDSGLMHLSAAVGIPTLGLFGPSRASEYAPVGPRAAFVAAPGPEGSGRMDALDVATVVAAAERLLDRFPAMSSP
ncbi:MAG: glycosyltransferase family 9 protein [Gluconacetobacter diazotrophicus]|nr:glycosyltransferase family 9 protein [Gluconacetobacter diazotrophicus]